MSAKLAKQLRRAAKEMAATHGMPARDTIPDQVRTTFGRHAVRKINDPNTVRGIYRGLKQSVKRSKKHG